MLTSVIRTRKCSVIAFLLALTFAGCGSVETQSFQVSQNSNVEAAQIATDADFTSYDRLHAVDMGILGVPTVVVLRGGEEVERLSGRPLADPASALADALGLR